MIGKPLPLFDLDDLTRLTSECERLRAKLKRGGMDVRSRIRTEQKLAMAVARKIKLETRLGLGR
jgi:hypothetical protein